MLVEPSPLADVWLLMKTEQQQQQEAEAREERWEMKEKPMMRVAQMEKKKLHKAEEQARNQLAQCCRKRECDLEAKGTHRDKPDNPLLVWTSTSC